MNIPKEKCEQLLDKEQERVATSVLQLLNSIKFVIPEQPEMRNVYNTVLYSFKKTLTDEINREFLTNKKPH